MIINYSFYFFIIIVSFNSFNLSYIVIPFNTYNIENENSNEKLNITKFFYNNFESQIYARMNIGTPKKFIPIDLRMNNHGLLLGYLCNNDNLKCEESKYNINLSSSFYGDINNKKIYSSQYSGSYFAQDTFSFYSDMAMSSDHEIILNNISFLYTPKNEEGNNKNEEKYINDKICGTLGLAVNAYYYLTEEVNFIKILKKLEYINKYDFSFYFTSNTEGALIIGEEPHNYLPKKFNENNFRKINVLLDEYSNSGWRTEFTQIYFYTNNIKHKIKESKKGIFAIENKYIIGSKDYQKSIEDNFFKKYIDNKICYYETIKNNQKYLVLICDKTSSFDINSFPTLYFYHRIFNYTFEFSKEDLFLEKNDKYIFLIFFMEYGNSYFTLGKLFLKKYLLVFNIDSKTIGFYNSILEYESEQIINSVSVYYKILGIIIILIACGIGFVFAKKVYEQTRKKRLNEIEEQYEYKGHDTNNINYEGNGNKKILLEIPLKI